MIKAQDPSPNHQCVRKLYVCKDHDEGSFIKTVKYPCIKNQLFTFGVSTTKHASPWYNFHTYKQNSCLIRRYYDYVIP